MLYAEMQGAQHAFEIFPSYRTARVIEAVERFLHSIHRAYLRGVDEPCRSRRRAGLVQNDKVDN